MDLFKSLRSLIDSDVLPGHWRPSRAWAYQRDGFKRLFVIIHDVDEPSRQLEFVLKLRNGGYHCVRARLMHHNRLLLYKEVI